MFPVPVGGETGLVYHPMLRLPRGYRRPGATVALALLVGVLPLAATTAAEARSAKGKPGATKSGAGKSGATRTKVSKKSAPRAPKVVPNPEGKIVVFPVKDDDDNSISAQIERLLRAHGLEVVAGVRPVDTAEQYREMAGTLGLAAYVDGAFKEGPTNARVTIQLRSGYTGRRVAQITFKETKLHLRGEIEDKLWSKLGPAVARTCADATKPRKRGRGPLVIEAGTPIAATD